MNVLAVIIGTFFHGRYQLNFPSVSSTIPVKISPATRSTCHCLGSENKDCESDYQLALVTNNNGLHIGLCKYWHVKTVDCEHVVIEHMCDGMAYLVSAISNLDLCVCTVNKIDVYDLDTSTQHIRQRAIRAHRQLRRVHNDDAVYACLTHSDMSTLMWYCRTLYAVAAFYSPETENPEWLLYASLMWKDYSEYTNFGYLVKSIKFELWRLIIYIMFDQSVIDVDDISPLIEGVKHRLNSIPISVSIDTKMKQVSAVIFADIDEKLDYLADMFQQELDLVEDTS